MEPWFLAHVLLHVALSSLRCWKSSDQCYWNTINLSKFTSSTNNHHTVLFTDDTSLLSKGDDKQSLEQSFGLLSFLFITWPSANNCYLNGFNDEIPKFSTQSSSQYQYHIDLQPKDTHHSTKFSSKTIFNGIRISISFVKKLNSSTQALRQPSSITYVPKSTSIGIFSNTWISSII